MDELDHDLARPVGRAAPAVAGIVTLLLLAHEAAGAVDLANAAAQCLVQRGEKQKCLVAEADALDLVLGDERRDLSLLALFDDGDDVAASNAAAIVSRQLKNGAVEGRLDGDAIAARAVGFVALSRQLDLMLGEAHLGFDAGDLADELVAVVEPLADVAACQGDARVELEAAAFELLQHA